MKEQSRNENRANLHEALKDLGSSLIGFDRKKSENEKKNQAFQDLKKIAKDQTGTGHWMGLEQVRSDYWGDPVETEKRSQEFLDKPVETIDLIDRTDTFGIRRREFLTIMGASVALASVACVRKPARKIIPYVVKPEEITPGIPNYYASTYSEGDVFSGILVKTREGRPIKIEPNPDHPMGYGSTARAQASVLDLYDPERLKNPIRRTKGSGSSQGVEWTAVDSELKAALSQADSVRVLSTKISGEASREVLENFISQFKDGAWVEYDPLQSDEISEAQKLSYGSAVQPGYDLESADFVLSLGCDFLGTHGSETENSRAWAKKRNLKKAKNEYSKVVTFESTMTVTGSNSDERFPVRPGDELKVALSVVRELHSMGLSLGRNASFEDVLSAHSAEKISEEIGSFESAKIKEIAKELSKNRGKSLVLAGGVHTKSENALALQIVVNYLNSLLGNEGSTVDGNGSKSSLSGSSFQEVLKLASDLKAGKVDALILLHSNPVYSFAKELGFEELLKNAKLVVTVSDRDDETAQVSDFVLPDHHYLESWGDAHPRKDLYSLQQPVIHPLHNTKAYQDIFLSISPKKIGRETWYDTLRSYWESKIYPRAGKISLGFQGFWEDTLRTGFVSFGSSRPSVRSFKVDSLSRVRRTKSASPDQVQLVIYQKAGAYDGRTANNAWLQELPDPVSTITWDNYLNISPKLAKKLAIKQNDVVSVSLENGNKVELPANIQPGLHGSVVSAAFGYGRRNAGHVGNFTGVDLTPMVQVQEEALVFSGALVSVQKTGRFYKLARTQEHNYSENRPILNDVTLEEFLENPGVMNHTDPHIKHPGVYDRTLWKEHEYKGYRWGMAIDLNSCTGCGSCVIACQAENNIPVVGRDNVRMSREMHWIRIDRYYRGDEENPEVVFQPMLCQHCENAPCETVCPVLATVHGFEGLNEMVYNRCVGTRYCQNNCPYKVRRFNFFDHWKSYSNTMNLVWNPDVTVRSRGVMEKCTFCVQRINQARNKAVLENRKIKDGDVVVACQSACPTDAISFGDVNDPDSKVSKLRAEERAFKSLEILNTKPMVSYMTKVRNRKPHEHDHGGDAHH